MTPTQEQIDNRRKLIAYLRGELKAEFDMNKFDDGFHLHERCATDCGSVGCAIGHGPYAGIQKVKGENWGRYSERVFGIDIDSILWEFCFSWNWDIFDNTSNGAAQRLEFITNNTTSEEQIKSMIPWYPTI